ncbi:DUF485 domain-containing protein [Streptomyces sp. NRRL S-1022]|uniref:DUF485 domain-containing protein n=1 Tax=Streptomyces sp. NRRL S-1022 TaxID=1463880 RepID=UPI0004C1F9E7|nr:DUF485 domain-containing protein [Streptomyces sp. NRRL S-1022]
MTHPDDRYPPTAPPGRTQRDPWRYDAPAYAPYDPYGQAGHRPPHVLQPQPPGPDLTALRSAYRGLRRVSTLAALGSFVAYVLLSCWAPDLMGSEIAGALSLGMGMGILQLLVTFAAVFWYGRSARRSVDPLAQAVRERSVRPARDAGVAG